VFLTHIVEANAIDSQTKIGATFKTIFNKVFFWREGGARTVALTLAFANTVAFYYLGTIRAGQDVKIRSTGVFTERRFVILNGVVVPSFGFYHVYYSKIGYTGVYENTPVRILRLIATDILDVIEPTQLGKYTTYVIYERNPRATTTSHFIGFVRANNKTNAYSDN